MGVLTGCLRIAHESIFTGLNNMRVVSVDNPYFDQYFGFTPDEVKQILDYYQLSNHYEALENWYDGYLFGRQHIFCPWDVISYVADLLNNPAIEPQNYWANSSSNEVVDHFIENGLSATVQDQLQRLVNGDPVQLTLRNDLTYQNMYQDSENLFSLLYSTGYLTSKAFSNSQTVNLVIQNVEIRQIFVESILNQAIKKAVGKSTMLNQLYHSFIAFQTDKTCELFQQYLQQTISVRDTFNQVRLKKNFYHGLLLGMLSANNQWSEKSNQKSGDGYADILVHTPTIGMVFEIKYAHTGDLELSCRKGMEQILTKNYANYFNYEANQLYGRPLDKIYLYSIACYGKRCHIEAKQLV